MSEPIIHSKSIAEIRAVFGLDKPTHPLITILDTEKLAYGEETVGNRFSSDLFCIALKIQAVVLITDETHMILMMVC